MATPDAREDNAPCAQAIAQSAVCEAANKRAVELMNARNLEAATAVFDVQTGALIAFAATPGPDSERKDAEPLKVTTPILPLSLIKLFLAASWWDRDLPERSFDCTRSATPDKREPMTIGEMIVSGCDLPAKQMAVALRKQALTGAVMADMERFGFRVPPKAARDNSFWAEISSVWQETLVPAASSTHLSEKTTDSDWADALSLGETNFITTVLHISSFLQAVGNHGVLMPPVARKETESPTAKTAVIPQRVVQPNTALRLQAAMRDVVQRGSAQSIALVLDGTGWQIGGKTGTGPGPGPITPQSDGWFAGLIFDPEGKARFTVATYVRHGGRGGENAAIVSAQLARYFIDK